MKIHHKIRIWLAVKIKWLRPYLLNSNEIEKISILELRSAFRFFGFDTSKMTDDDIKKGIDEMGKLVLKAGLSKEEAIELSNRMARL